MSGTPNAPAVLRRKASKSTVTLEKFHHRCQHLGVYDCLDHSMQIMHKLATGQPLDGYHEKAHAQSMGWLKKEDATADLVKGGGV